ncbi:MAG TPA: phosphatase PAP2 family protein [Candidatus Limnocylindrales bacterium]|nr:phosphatase PAP2 family protein [Candidatus Limnocylindrales bacterium]
METIQFNLHPARRQEANLGRIFFPRALDRHIQRVRVAAHAILEACGAFEWVALSYLGLSGLLMIVFCKHLPRAGRLLAIHSGFTAAVVGLVTSGRKSTTLFVKRSSFARFLQGARDWYPQAVFLFCFEELGALAHVLHRGWCDAWFLAFDRWLMGVYPTVWLAQFARPALTEFMQIAYLSYFFYLTILCIFLYCLGPDSHSLEHSGLRAFWAVMTSSMAAYAIGYVISILLPAESPYFFLAALHATPLLGGPVTRLSDLIEHIGRVHGGAFPSEHVAGSLVALLGAWRYRRGLFWIFLPFFACMCVSTVYVRNHYIADVLGGLIVGWIGFQIGHWLMQLPGSCPGRMIHESQSLVTAQAKISILQDAGEIPDALPQKVER